MKEINRNRLYNVSNPYQGTRKRVLSVCSAGLLRSPTIAWILSNPPFDFNTRACGINEDYALVPLDRALIEWADEIVVVEEYMKNAILRDSPKSVVHYIDTPDRYECRSQELIDILTPKLMEIFLENSTT